MAKIMASKKAKEARRYRNHKVVMEQKVEKAVTAKKKQNVVETKEVAKTAVETKAVEETAVEAVEKKAVKKTTKSAAIQVIYQFEGREVTEKELIAKVKEIWTSKGNKIKDITSLNIYIKPEEEMAYYVINDVENGKIEL